MQPMTGVTSFYLVDRVEGTQTKTTVTNQCSVGARPLDRANLTRVKDPNALPLDIDVDIVQVRASLQHLRDAELQSYNKFLVGWPRKLISTCQNAWYTEPRAWISTATKIDRYLQALPASPLTVSSEPRPSPQPPSQPPVEALSIPRLLSRPGPSSAFTLSTLPPHPSFTSPATSPVPPPLPSAGTSIPKVTVNTDVLDQLLRASLETHRLQESSKSGWLSFATAKVTTAVASIFSTASSALNLVRPQNAIPATPPALPSSEPTSTAIVPYRPRPHVDLPIILRRLAGRIRRIMPISTAAAATAPEQTGWFGSMFNKVTSVTTTVARSVLSAFFGSAAPDHIQAQTSKGPSALSGTPQPKLLTGNSVSDDELYYDLEDDDLDIEEFFEPDNDPDLEISPDPEPAAVTPPPPPSSWGSLKWAWSWVNINIA